MNGGTADEAAQLSRSKPIIMSGIVATILGWIFGVREAAKYLLQPRHPVSTENSAENATAETKAAQAGTDSIEADGHEIFTTAPTADVDVRPMAAGGISRTVPDQQEIERRRVLVRALFNDFWNGADNKPAAFAERLDQAEDYLNARLTAHGELWRLDANTRAMLGLPPRSSSPD